LQVSTFPWDPPPPPPPATNTGGFPSNEGETTASDGTLIKPEPASDVPPGPPQPPPGQPLSDPNIAAARAAQHVQSKFGGSAVPPHLNRTNTPSFASGGLMLPGKPQTPQPAPQQISGQTDGSYDDVQISTLDADGEINRVIAEGNLMRIQESALRSALEELKTQSATFEERKIQKKRKKSPVTIQTDYAGPSTAPHVSSQMDGPDDLDEDAINSDLDDSDDDPVDDDEDIEGVVPQIMLCMYDKVQRTKNKWKCVLKDGVMTVNGKECVLLQVVS